MTPYSPTPVRLGMAGAIYLPTGAAHRAADERWLRESFVETAWTRRTEWASSDLFALSHEHIGEAGGESGRRTEAVPSAGSLQGLAFAQAFGTGQDEGMAGRSRAMLQAFLAGGPSRLEGSNGPWAGVVWDSGAQQAVLLRDGLGAETLFYARAEGRLLFATDLRVFQRLEPFSRVDERAALEFLHYLYVPTPLTLMSGVNAVLPGHALWIPDGHRQERFEPPRFRGDEATLGPEQIEARVREELPHFREHVLQAVADAVPRTGRIALALSGGKDSSAMAIALSEICPDRVLAFTVGAVETKYNETADAALVSRTLGFEFMPYLPTDRELVDGLELFLSSQGQPTGDPAAYPYFLAMKNLPDDCSVVFDGTGTDYYFGMPTVPKGEHIYSRRVRLERKLPAVVWRGLLKLLSAGTQEMRSLREHWDKPIEETFVPWQAWTEAELESISGHAVSFADTYLWKVMQQGSPERWVDLLTEFVCHVWEPHAAYRKAVQFSHALGLGIRFPFADVRISSYMNTLPVELKYSGGRNKVLLRAYLATRLPQEILAKPKSPFVFELNRLLANPGYDWLGDLKTHGLFTPFPSWNDRPFDVVLREFAAAPLTKAWQQRLYALGLLASVAGLPRGWRPSGAR